MLSDNFNFYFLNLLDFKNRTFSILFFYYFSNWFSFIKIIKRKKIAIAIFNLDLEHEFTLKEIGFIYLLKAHKISVIFESERSHDLIGIHNYFSRKLFLKLVRGSLLILPDEKMKSIYKSHFASSNIHYITLQTHSIKHFNSAKASKIALGMQPVSFYMYLNDIEQAILILKLCQKLKQLHFDFKFNFTSKQLLTFLPQLNEQIRRMNLLEKVSYMTINKLNSGDFNGILIHHSHPKDNFFPQEVVNALCQGRVVIGGQELVENGLVIPSVNGSIFDLKESNSLFNAMKYYLSNPNKIYTMGIASNTIYHSYFSKATIGKKLLSVLLKLSRAT